MDITEALKAEQAYMADLIKAALPKTNADARLEMARAMMGERFSSGQWPTAEQIVLRWQRAA